MNARLLRRLGAVVAALLLVAGTAAAEEIAARDARVDGLSLHYLTAGRGPGLILLHGYTQTSRMWRPVMPTFAARYTVVAPDLPGIGDSEIPGDGLDMKSAAVRVHALVRSLGISKASVVGHDIGLMVAYAYAAMYPNEVERLVVLDAFLPGVEGWRIAYDSPDYWHFRFHGPTPEQLVAGRERIYYDYYWNAFAADPKRSLSDADRAFYVAAYSRPGRMRAGWGYFAGFPQTAKDFAELSKTRLSIPVLSVGGDHSLGELLGGQMKLVAANVTVIVLKDTGHWLLEERPKETTDALLKFL